MFNPLSTLERSCYGETQAIYNRSKSLFTVYVFHVKKNKALHVKRNKALHVKKKWEKMKSNETRRQTLGRQNSWQQAKHAKLVSDLLKASRREPLISLRGQ